MSAVKRRARDTPARLATIAEDEDVASMIATGGSLYWTPYPLDSTVYVLQPDHRAASLAAGRRLRDRRSRNHPALWPHGGRCEHLFRLLAGPLDHGRRETRGSGTNVRASLRLPPGRPGATDDKPPRIIFAFEIRPAYLYTVTAGADTAQAHAPGGSVAPVRRASASEVTACRAWGKAARY